jgi:hypothetical protein
MYFVCVPIFKKLALRQALGQTLVLRLVITVDRTPSLDMVAKPADNAARRYAYPTMLTFVMLMLILV